MAQLTMQSPEMPKPEDEGLTLQEIHWLPLVVPGCAVLLALVGLAVMSVA
jgi:hypothetical protein